MEADNLVEVTRWGKVQAWWLRHPGIEADHFGVLAALSTYADEHGFCEPSQATLARWLKRSRPWVNRVIAELVEVGLLEKAARTRNNGGTTSCRYRLLAAAPSRASAVDPLTQGVRSGDSPRQPPDTNQHDPKHNQEPARCPQAHEHSSQSRPTRLISDVVEIDWQPSPAAVRRALDLYPDLDVVEHTTLFVSRCRGKGYQVRRGGEDDIWLAWLIEDRRKASAPTSRTTATARDEHGQRPWQSKDARTNRFAAWGLAASRPTRP